MNYPGGGEGNVLIAVGNNATTVNYWLFDNTGNLRLPGNTFAVNYANGTQVSLGGVSGFSGISGFSGAGTSGFSGDSGISGFSGVSGFSGISGFSGLTGPIAGSNTQIVFNDAGTANGSANLTFDKTTSVLTVNGNISTGGSNGNITGANVISATTLTATANVNGGNLVTTGVLSVTSNANVGN
jgi:hypothetical protein